MNSVTQCILPHFYYLFINEGRLGWLRFLAIVPRAAMSMAEQAPMEQSAESLGQMPQGGIAGSYDRFIFSFF